MNYLTIITWILNLIKSGFSIIKKYYKWFIAGIFILLCSTIYILSNKISKNNREIERLQNNTLAYEQMISNTQEKNRVLQLTIDDLNTNKDSIIQQLKDTQSKLKIKDKDIKTITIVKTKVKDSTQVVIPDSLLTFRKELNLNKLTKVIVNRQDSILKVILQLENTQTLFIIEKKEYKNQYKNGWTRFWHFDWHKVKRRTYEIDNSNPIIKVVDTRVIEITQ